MTSLRVSAPMAGRWVRHATSYRDLLGVLIHGIRGVRHALQYDTDNMNVLTVSKKLLVGSQCMP